MEKRPLGNTGHKVGIFSLGGESTIKAEGEDKQAIELINTALDLGINYIDTAPAYGPNRSEKRIGKIIKEGRRKEFYLATKCDKRTKEDAWKQINQSIENLGATPNCIQLHHLDKIEEIEKIFGPNGAMKSLLKAKNQGLTKYLGVTGHSNPSIIMEALRRYPFDTVLGALNIADPYHYCFQATLIPYCESKKIGYIAMKTCARGKIFNNDDKISMQSCLDYVWSIPGVSTAIVGIENEIQLRRNIEIAKNFKKLSYMKKHELEQLVESNQEKALYFRKGNKWLDDDFIQLVR